MTHLFFILDDFSHDIDHGYIYETKGFIDCDEPELVLPDTIVFSRKRLVGTLHAADSNCLNNCLARSDLCSPGLDVRRRGKIIANNSK